MSVLPFGSAESTITINVRCRTYLIYVNATSLYPPQSESIEFRAHKSRVIGERHVKIQARVVIFILAHCRCRPRPTQLKAAAVVEDMVVGGRWACRWWRWAMPVVAADMPAAVAATLALPAAAVARVTSAPDRLYPIRLRHQGRAPQVRAPIDLPRAHSANNAAGRTTPLKATGNATRNANRTVNQTSDLTLCAPR